MPKIPLLLEVRPSLSKEGPRVFLSTGIWRISSDIKDSELELISPAGVVPLIHGMTVSNGVQQVRFKKAGTERLISVYAEKE